ncbi:MAG: radical SAM/Cys-rich domain protein [Coriobacteriia bacterium]|nr:radical SAM/Cys-rich domain protein [Coriobacteriia bacterium]
MCISADKGQNKTTTFDEIVADLDVSLSRTSLDTVQVNVGHLCNQSCIHCHVEAGPARTETMSEETARLVLDLVDEVVPKTVDITGGAPELCPSFRFLVEELTRRGVHVIDRSNLTVMLVDGMEDLPAFLAENKVEIVASLPCYTAENVDAQRGPGVYEKSMEALRRLNALGYGVDGSGLVLNLVYNPLGASLPGSQAALEADYHRELWDRAGVVFNHLFTITNMQIGRYADLLDENGKADDYRQLLASTFNPDTLSSLMCLNQVSVAWDGCLYDCDFNQVLEMPCCDDPALRLGDVSVHEVARRLIGARISTAEHCWACTAGTGSSCGGALAQ